MTYKKVQAIIFDVDGTLIDSPVMIYAAMAYIARKHGLPKRTNAEVRAQIGKPMLDIFRGLWLDADPEPLLVTNNEFVAKNSGLAKLYSGLEETLEKINQQGILMAAVTSGGAGVARVLEHHKIHKFFPVVVHSEMLKKHKPDPEGILLALQMLKVAPENAVMVGDMYYDIEAGKNAGVLSTIGLTHGYGSRKSLEKAGADHIIDSFAELPGIIADL